MDKCVRLPTIQEAIDILRGAVTIVYPMGLPPHDPIRAEFENTEDLSGTQVCSCHSKLIKWKHEHATRDVLRYISAWSLIQIFDKCISDWNKKTLIFFMEIEYE